MARNIFTALDVGTSTVQTVVAEKKRGENDLRILGIGIAPSAGVRKGVVVDLDDASSSIRQSVQEAERSSGMNLKSACVAVGGSHISVASSKGVVAVSRADGEISPEDVRRAIAAAETFVARNPNKHVLHMIPRDFKVDNEAGVKDPIGMHGVRLEVDTLIIECSASFLKNLFKCVEAAGLSVEDYVFAPLAASYAVLSKRSRELGVMLLDIGGGVASFVVFEEGVPMHAGVVPIGGNLITNDVAIGFRTHVDIAERIKVSYGSCLPDELPKRETIRLAEFIPEETAVFSRRELAEIIEARMRDIFELLQKELKKIDRKQLLPAGVILVGGSSSLPGLVDLTRKEMGLPVEIGFPPSPEVLDTALAPVLATAIGAIHWQEIQNQRIFVGSSNRMPGLRTNPWVRWLRSLLP
ncbi:MAG: cell division protein FtsA [Candidatus Sungbacteria bacterium]|nr:cell division protein FtsA [bacterium]MDZ4260123.1 cell division protein FtsA [Candidatus Sungbacteria bacterium]